MSSLFFSFCYRFLDRLYETADHGQRLSLAAEDIFDAVDDADQAKDISFGRDYHVAVNDGKSTVTVDRIVLSPIGCSVYMTGSYSAEGSLDYFENVKIKLKNGAYLDDTCYEMGMSESVISSDEEGSHEEVKKEFSFEFRVPIDIRQVASVEVFGEECRIEPGEDTNP